MSGARGSAAKRKSTGARSTRLKANPDFFKSSPSGSTSDGTVPLALLNQARKSGLLNLSNRGIKEIPKKVWRLNIDPPEGSSSSFDEGERWWDQAELTRIDLSSNELREISPDIENFVSLLTLELQYNQLECLPDTIGKLQNLSKLYLSYNQLQTLPDEIGSLIQLHSLLLSHNQLTRLPETLTDLVHLEELDISSNQLELLPSTMNKMIHLRSLDVSENRLREIPPHLGELKNLSKLNLGQNKLTDLPPLSNLENITEIVIKQNQLTEFPLIQPGNTLKCLMLGVNKIQSLPEDRFTHLTELTILSLRDNKLTKLPESIVLLSMLQRLDLSNNDLSSLPYVLGRLETLHSLILDGNPLRTIRRDIISRGTVELLKHLRSRIEVDPIDSSLPPLSPSSTTKALSSPYREFRDPSPAAKNEIDLTKSNLTELPDNCFELITTTSLNVGFNKLTSLPDLIGRLQWLVSLDLRKNLLCELPSSLSSCSRLRYLNISCNRFSLVPLVVYDCTSLENLLAGTNQISQLDVEKLMKLTSLVTLDVSNNNISQIPPQLGRMEWLRHLELTGNSFRIPRPAVLAKGTASVLEYLRDRIPT